MQNDNTTRRTESGSNGHLERLKDMHRYKVAEGDLDITGWDVKTADGLKVGEVDTLIVDTDALKVRYIDVELDKHALKLDHKRHVVLPIGTARLDKNDECVMLGATSTIAQLTELSATERTTLDRDAESALRRRLDNDYRENENSTQDFYAHPQYDQDQFFGDRRKNQGDKAYFESSN